MYLIHVPMKLTVLWCHATHENLYLLSRAVKIPSHIKRRYGRKSFAKALLRSQGIQDDTPTHDAPPPGHNQGASEDEPRNKNGEEEEEEEEEEHGEPLCKKLGTFVGTVVDMLIGWLNSNSEDYRYVVQRVRGRTDRSGEGIGGAEPSFKASEPSQHQPADISGPQVEGVENRGDVIVEVLHLEPSAAEKDEAGALERELIGAAEKRVDKVRQFLNALYYCFLAHSEYVVYFMIILNVLLNGSVLSLVYAFLMFCWGLLSFPWPSRKFWVVMMFYTMFVILVRYAFQFKQADFGSDCLSQNVKRGRCPTQIVGIYYYGSSFYSSIVWDFILLMAVFLHTALLKVGHR